MEVRHHAQFRPPPESVMKTGRWKHVAAVVRSWAAAFLIVIAVLSAPAWAHKGEERPQAGQAQQPQQAQQSGAGAGVAAAPGSAAANPEMMDGMDMGMGMNMDRSKLPFFERLFGWFGRLHPLLVHFPIAFFPAALFTAIVGRRRPAFAAPVQFLVVAGGIFAPIAAAAGWLTGMTADPEPILAWHRWIGVTVGVAGAGLGVWAWKRPWEDRGAGMILGLTLMTIAIAVQGFLGAGLTHGIDHLMF